MPFALAFFARSLLAEVIEHQDFDMLVDPRLEKNYVDHEMFRMIEAAPCLVRALDSLDESSDLTYEMKPGQSEVYDSAQQFAQIRMFQRLAFGCQDYSSSFFNHSQSSWRSRDNKVAGRVEITEIQVAAGVENKGIEIIGIRAVAGVENKGIEIMGIRTVAGAKNKGIGTP
ncbi:hypothetical protein PVK06_021082 [Gossypium arboreum]|uniref:Uncharacterized protein n=1 Tax=Gossypium arboreum TaxID=29729 RepID=A0ABR0PP09_GOSAR|nr:hypothetical protein PVK06_021082 [Gossypium arboreum]